MSFDDRKNYLGKSSACTARTLGEEFGRIPNAWIRGRSNELFVGTSGKLICSTIIRFARPKYKTKGFAVSSYNSF